LILRKITEIVVTVSHILKINFGWSSALDSLGKLTALPRLCYIFGVLTSNGREGEGNEKEGEG